MSWLRRAPAAGPWELIASFLDQESVSSLQALLDGARTHLDVPLVDLYLPDGDRFRFAHRAQSVSQAGAASVDDDGAGLVSMMALPPLSLPRDEVRHGALVGRKQGQLLQWELARDGATTGVLELGPLKPGQDATLARTLESWTEPLAFFVGRAAREARSEETVRRLQANVEVRERIIRAMVDPGAYMQLLVQVAIVTTKADAGFISTEGPDGRPRIVASQGLPEAFRREVRFDPRDGLLDVDLELGTVAVRDTEFLARMGCTSLLALPLVPEERLEGVVAVLNFGTTASPPSQALRVLRVVVDQIGLVLREQRLYQDFSARYLGSLKSLAGALDAGGSQGSDHHAWVAQLAVSIGRALGLDEDALQRTRDAAEIHDVGLCAIALDSAGTAYNDHPVIGEALLGMLPGAAEVARAVRCQHEWFNGWGFPDGLSGEAIPLEGQVLAMAEFGADVRGQAGSTAPFADRFKGAVLERSGTQFNPRLVEAVMQMDREALHE
ncbi:MAG TPA: HD domain-containing phosphohydrolase [Chloroflexota bacterium]|nr:HD domain-containing phosphohydrolase [Chloroflexota bacterium]